MTPTERLAEIDKEWKALADQYNAELITLNTWRGDLLAQIARLRVEREELEQMAHD